MVTAMKESRSDKLFLVFIYLFLAAALVVVLYPLIYILSASISTPKFVSSGEMWLLPKGLTLDGYKLVMQNPKIWIGYGNTIFLHRSRNVHQSARYAACGVCAEPLGFYRTPVYYGDVPGHDVFQRRAGAKLPAGEGAGHDQFDLGAYPACIGLGMEHYCRPDIFPVNHSEGAAGGGPYGRLYEYAPVLPDCAAAVGTDYRGDGLVLRGIALEQLFLITHLSQ